MTTEEAGFLAQSGPPAVQARPSTWSGEDARRFPHRSSQVRVLARVCCIVALLVPRAVAVKAETEARAPHSRGMEPIAAQGAMRHGRAASSSSGGQPGATAAEKAPFIRPIAPMSPLFADDDLLRVPWSRFGFHRAPVRSSRVIVSMIRHNQRKPKEDVLSQSLATASADVASTLTRLAQRPANMFWETSELPANASAPVPSSGISPARATQIQAALVRYGYLSGAPTGNWNPTSVAAMRQLQSDHRWQTKFIPDARALIFLGLGPGSRAE